MAAGETENPRVVLPKAFKAVFYRLTTFFMLGSLAVGILVPYNDPGLIKAYATGAPGAAASPYVASMVRLNIGVLPHIVNALVLTSALSAGNSYCYCASRSLYGLALEGKAPKFMTKCTKNGVPIYCVLAVLLISLLAFLQVSNSAAVVLSWFVSLVSLLSSAPNSANPCRSLHLNSSISALCVSHILHSAEHWLHKVLAEILFHTSLSGNHGELGML